MLALLVSSAAGSSPIFNIIATAMRALQFSNPRSAAGTTATATASAIPRLASAIATPASPALTAKSGICQNNCSGHGMCVQPTLPQHGAAAPRSLNPNPSAADLLALYPWPAGCECFDGFTGRRLLAAPL